MFLCIVSCTQGFRGEDLRDKIDCFLPGCSRYHIFKSSPTNYFLLADSQARYLEAGNLNILSLPVACLLHAYNIIPHKIEFEIIILFFGGNDLFGGFEPSPIFPQKNAQDFLELAVFACQRVESNVFVLGLSGREENRIKASQANAILKTKAEKTPQTRRRSQVGISQC